MSDELVVTTFGLNDCGANEEGEYHVVIHDGVVVRAEGPGAQRHLDVLRSALKKLVKP